MESQSYANPVGWTIVAIGLGLACIAAFSPHFNAGYRLMTDVLLAGMLPYLVYAIAVPLMRNAITAATGLVLIIVHGAAVVYQRLMGIADFNDSNLYVVPIIMAVIVSPLAVIALSKSRTHRAANRDIYHQAG